ncbi:MAG: serine hydroxymethyltransferase, partial [Bacilli bacterium]|nr:serine hydroxymethyltransferase [Bacilli bacterium]
VREAQGSIFTAKYAEGYPGHRYYGGCENVDAVESLAIERAKKLFQVPYANVQPHSGSQANAAAYHALLPQGGKILSLTLNDGGHLTHGSPVSFSSHDYDFVFYSLDEEGKLDYDSIGELLVEEKPDLLLAGYSAYPFAIDFKRLRDILDDYHLNAEKPCLFMVDMAHIAGIVAAGLCQNPCLYADVVTSTTHKTLRGPRGGLILSRHEDYAKKLNAAIFPYSQGGPLEHIIAAKAVAFAEALHPDFQTYMKQVLTNTKVCSDELAALGAEVSGSENHLFLVNVKKSYGLTGKEAESRLGEIGITVNKNMIHGDEEKPAFTSGLRLGFAAATSRGCTKEDAKKIAQIIDSCLKKESSLEDLKKRTEEIASSWKDVMELSYPLGE